MVTGDTKDNGIISIQEKELCHYGNATNHKYIPDTMINTVNIRKATRADAPAIASYILLAMGDIIYHLIGGHNAAGANAAMLHWVSETGNQYSYNNCWVAEVDNNVVAAACVYNGADLATLRAPVTAYLRRHYHTTPLLEPETEDGEIYIDCLGVDPAQQGRGIGAAVLRFLIQEYVTGKQQTLGLLVDTGNPDAKRLYLKLGFTLTGLKAFAGKTMEHLQLSPAV